MAAIITPLVPYLPVGAERDRQDTKFLENAKVRNNPRDERTEVDGLSQPANMGNRRHVGLITQLVPYSPNRCAAREARYGDLRGAKVKSNLGDEESSVNCLPQQVDMENRGQVGLILNQVRGCIRDAKQMALTNTRKKEKQIISLSIWSAASTAIETLALFFLLLGTNVLGLSLIGLGLCTEINGWIQCAPKIAKSIKEERLIQEHIKQLERLKTKIKKVSSNDLSVLAQLNCARKALFKTVQNHLVPSFVHP